MATDAPLAGRRSAPCLDAPTSDLVAQVNNYSRTVIEAELRRLSRKAPSLRPDDLELIDAALDGLVESLLLARLRNAPPATEPLLRRLFSTESEGP